MKKSFKLSAVVIFFLFGMLNVNAQDEKNVLDSNFVIITTNDGNDVTGTIISEDARELTIKLTNGKTVIIPAYIVKSRKIITKENIIGGQIVYSNPHPSRYFYTPSALPMKKDEVYLQSVYYIYYHAQIGLTDNFSIGGATTFLGAPVFLTGKYSIKVSEKDHFAIGGIFGNMSWMRPETNLGIGFVNYTHGTAEYNFTITAGYSGITNINKKVGETHHYDTVTNYYYTNVIMRKQNSYSPIFTFCGNTRITRNMSLMCEFWYLPDEDLAFGGPCLRLYTTKNNSYDFGIFGYFDEANSYAFPVFSYTYKFDK